MGIFNFSGGKNKEIHKHLLTISKDESTITNEDLQELSDDKKMVVFLQDEENMLREDIRWASVNMNQSIGDIQHGKHSHRFIREALTRLSDKQHLLDHVFEHAIHLSEQEVGDYNSMKTHLSEAEQGLSLAKTSPTVTTVLKKIDSYFKRANSESANILLKQRALAKDVGLMRQDLKSVSDMMHQYGDALQKDKNPDITLLNKSIKILDIYRVAVQRARVLISELTSEEREKIVLDREISALLKKESTSLAA